MHLILVFYKLKLEGHSELPVLCVLISANIYYNNKLLRSTIIIIPAAKYVPAFGLFYI